MAMVNIEEPMVDKKAKTRSNTHSRLVEIARKWLRSSSKTKSRCFPVICELVTSAGEVPDAIGWVGGTSILIECKTSRSDFYADAKKPWRVCPSRAMGNLRYFMAHPGIIKPASLPNGWGLLEASETGKVTEIIPAIYQQFCNKENEIKVLASVIRRNAEEASA